MRSLIRRLDRLDGGDGRYLRLSDMTDAQLSRVIARRQPNPAAFLARLETMSESEVDMLLERMLEGKAP